MTLCVVRSRLTFALNGVLAMLKKLVMLCVALALSLSAGFAAAVEVNSADQAALESVKGIGPAHAKAIIEERTKNGPFKDADDLATRVKGIGSKSVVNLEAAGLTINGSSTPPTGAKPAAKSTATKTAPAANTPANTTATTTATTTAIPAAPADASGTKASKSSKKKAKAAASDATAASAPAAAATAPAAPAAAASAPADASGAKASKKKAKKSKAASAAAASGGA
ncbi:helix-hairpin-helix domain-containing protein [Paraburkholderia kirstenboschensis]|uniref:Helix-hairpin-helix domain-containing protein n=2 Tax=Paraburkholderia kirstenboschensis TaxID=1245436 RepID=A0ABZ0EU55_9BURK|nr:helix-hairpin-helix domain-containing protein [Paraburkholderia kirstenboschensis]WOD19914.1 helix-hairpin-helix domain-containing protein [Paraburkholderia kirstenboschensis]